MRASTALEERPEITTGSTPRSRAHSSARPSRIQKCLESPTPSKPITPSVSVPSTSKKMIRTGSVTGSGMGGLGNRLAHPQRLVEQARDLGERDLRGGVRERPRRIGVRLEEQPVGAARHGGAD